MATLRRYLQRYPYERIKKQTLVLVYEGSFFLKHERNFRAEEFKPFQMKETEQQPIHQVVKKHVKCWYKKHFMVNQSKISSVMEQNSSFPLYFLYVYHC